MELIIKHQEHYSRLQLVLRTLFGWLYMIIPHVFVLYILAIANGILTFIAWFAILFTGRYPRSFFNFTLGVTRWSLRLAARILNLSDGYPPFSLCAADENVKFELPYPERLSRGMLLVKTLFGIFYVIIPHFVVLYILLIPVGIFSIIAWFSILFTGQYPKMMHDFVTGWLRWATRVQVYFIMSDSYPPFKLS